MTPDQGNNGQGPEPRLSLLVPATVFLGSFLLFWVQPMLGRALLPRFGGSAAVWAVCLAAYQTLLLAGYAYAYLLCRLSARTRARWHLGILLAAGIWMLGLLALQPTPVAWPHVTGWPTLDVLLCVLLSVGLPYGLLSAGSTLVQKWVAGDPGARHVYRLYAISNLGSLLGLLAYPLALEPFTALQVQWRIWAVLFVGYTLLLGWMLRLLARRPGASPSHEAGREPEAPVAVTETSLLPESLSRPWLWVTLPAVTSFLLVAVTNHLSTDVTPIPLLWAVLLAAFLLSYVVGFSRVGERGLSLWLVLAIAALTTKVLLRSEGGQRGFLPALFAGVALVFLAPLFLHAWLFAIRPVARRLAGYYLALAAGGALGGALASLAAPLLFTTIAEFPLALVMVAALGAWYAHTRADPELRGINETILVCCLAVPLVLGWRGWNGSREVVHRARNFYGALKVTESTLRAPTGRQGVVRRLTHGGTLHGAQAIMQGRASRATTYYGPLGGGLALRWHPSYSNGAPMRVGCIGLGIGTMAAYGRTNDTYRFYEINPDVVAVASNTNLFTYLSDCPARVEIQLGDARQTLERERTEHAAPLDVLIVDAYSGDAVPIHLATREAFDLYAARLAPGGILAVHISNWHIDLLPLCKAAGQFLGMNRRGVLSTGSQGSMVSSASWVFLSHAALDEPLPAQAARDIDWQAVRDLPLPTDARGSLLSLVRFGTRPPTLDSAFDWDAIDQLFR